MTGISLSPGLYQHERLSTDSLPSDVPCVHCSVVSVRMCVGHLQPIRGQLCVSVDQSEASVQSSVSMSAFLMVSAISRSHRQGVLSMTLLTIMLKFEFCLTNYVELDRGSKMSSLRDGLSTPYRETKE